MGILKIEKGDITVYGTDAIANAANTSLLGGGGVDGAIHRAAGPKLLEECKKLGGCSTGEAKITGGHGLKAKYILHTPGPVWHGGNHGEAALLRNSYENCLKLAQEYQCRTVAFPSISTGVYHFPLKEAAAIAVDTILGFLETSRVVEEVTMVCFNDHTKEAYDQALEQWEQNKIQDKI